MPDIDSLPPSFSPSRANASEPRHSPIPRPSSSSLSAAATINAGFQHEPPRRSSTLSSRDPTSPGFHLGQAERRRSSAFLSSYDPALPGPGELQTGDLRSQTDDQRPPMFGFGHRSSSPHGLGSPTYPPQYRDRAPSLGEIHQQLEQEQEAQVNRLLGMLRHQQGELQAIRDQAASNSLLGPAATGEITPPAERAISIAYPHRDHTSTLSQGTDPVNPPRSPNVRNSFALSRQSSHRSITPSRAPSPSFRPSSAGTYGQGEDSFYGGRTSQALMDESAFYQAETQTLTRENQMLRQRIRELERQLGDGGSTMTNSPAIASNLAAPPIEAEQAEAVSVNEHERKED